MSTLSQYRSLFSIRILQEYHLPEEPELYPTPVIRDALLNQLTTNYDVHQDLLIVPVKETEQLLKDYRLKFKRNNFGFFISCQTEAILAGGFQPFIELDEPLSLRFAVFQRNPFFFNYTNLRLEQTTVDDDQFVYYFSNRANNTLGGNYLSQAIQGFNGVLNYTAGEIIIEFFDGSNHLLEAIEDNSVAPVFSLPGGNVAVDPPWRLIYENEVPLPQFVTVGDRVVIQPSFFRHNVESAALETLIININNLAGVPVKSITYVSNESGAPLSTCSVDLSDLPKGLYDLEVQGIGGPVITDLGQRFYLDSNLIIRRPLAIIECFHEPDGSLGDYRWVDESANDQILSPEYLIRWKNRSTFWRYYYDPVDAPTLTIGEPDDVETFEINPGVFVNNILVSNQPLGLTKVGRSVEINEGGDIILLPNPEINSIFPENGRLYSEINMGGGFGPP